MSMSRKFQDTLPMHKKDLPKMQSGEYSSKHSQLKAYAMSKEYKHMEKDHDFHETFPSDHIKVRHQTQIEMQPSKSKLPKRQIEFLKEKYSKDPKKFFFFYFIYRAKRGPASYLTNEDYNMIVSTDTLTDMKELSKNIIEIFEREHRSKIFVKIQKKKELTEGDKIAVNCVSALTANIGKLVYKEGSLSNEDRNYFLEFMGKYLSQLFPYIGSHIVAMRLTEAILYTICNIFNVTGMGNRTYWSKILSKYFQTKALTMEIKLAAAVAISYIAYWNMNIKQLGDIIAFMSSLPRNNDQMGSPRSTDIAFMGFTGHEIDRAANLIISVLVGYLDDKEAAKGSLDESFLSQTYEVLLRFEDESRLYISSPNICLLSNGIIGMFGVHFKPAIINQLENGVAISPREKLVLNCLYVSVNILGKIYQTHRSLKFTGAKDFRDIFEGFFKLIKVNAIANRMCESILYAMCNIYEPFAKVPDKHLWRPTLKECREGITSSQEIKLASSVLLGLIATVDDEFDFDVLLFLLRTMYLFVDGRSEYLGFEPLEITRTVTHMIQTLSKTVEKHFRVDSECVGKINQMLCHIYENEPYKDIPYQTALIGLIMSIMKSFQLSSNIKEHLALSKSEKIYLNCFCNALNVLGQNIFEDIEYDSMMELCRMIFVHLGNLQDLFEHNIIASRMAETLLYCLCNLLHGTKKCKFRSIYGNYLPCQGDWSDILWTYFNSPKSSSNEAKIASCVALVITIRYEEKPSANNVDVLHGFLRAVRDEVNKSCSSKSYLGFEIDEIDEAVNDIEALEQKFIDREPEKYLTKEDYNIIISIENLSGMNKLSKNIIETFDKEHKLTIFSKVRKKEELTYDQKVAVNCLYASMTNIGKLFYGEELPADEDQDYFPNIMGTYLRELFPHIGSHIVAIRLTEAILYTICNISNVTEMGGKTDWLEILLKYFQSNECSPEMKLASAVAISNIYPLNADIKEIVDIMTFFLNLPCDFDQMDFEESLLDFMGFAPFEIIRSAHKIFSTWIARLEKKEAVIDKLDESILSKTYQILLRINDGPRIYIGSVRTRLLVNSIIGIFSAHFKCAIINQLENGLEISPRQKVALNCAYVSVNMLSNIYQTILIFHIPLNEDFRDIFASFFKLIKVNAIANRMCESILYAMCNIYQPHVRVPDEQFWRSAWKECREGKTSSEEIKLASSVLLGVIVSEDDQFDFEILLFLLRTMTLFVDGKNEYLGFEPFEISRTIIHMIQTLSKTVEKHFRVESECVEKINQMLCHIYENEPFEDIWYRTALVNLIIPIMTSSQFVFESSLLSNIKEHLALSKSEKIYLNCFCNALNVLGQNIVEDIGRSSMFELCRMIFVHLGNLRDLFEHNIIVSRMAETLLYCLCNLFRTARKMFLQSQYWSYEQLKHDYPISFYYWSDILWAYFESGSSSCEIKIAACVALATAIWTEKELMLMNDTNELYRFLLGVRDDVRKYRSKSYLGFEINEIDEALDEIQRQCEEEDLTAYYSKLYSCTDLQ